MPRAATVPQPTPVVINQTVAPTETPEKKPAKGKPDFWTYIASLSPQDWRRHLVYLYRTKPIVGSKQNEKYLDKYAQKFTIDDVKERYGGEAFRAILLRDNSTYMTEDFSIEAAPKFDYARETPGADNSRDALVRELVDRVTDKANGSSDLVDDAMGRSMNIMTKAFETALEKTAGAGGNGNLLQTIQVLKELGLIAPPQPRGGDIRETIVLFKELGIIGGREPVNRVQEFREMLIAVKELTGDIAADATPGNWKTRLVDRAVEALPQIAGQVNGFLDKQATIEREKTHRMQIAANARAAASGQPVPHAQPAAAQTTHAPDHGQGVSGEPMRTVPLDRNAPPNAAPPAASADEGQPSQAWISRRIVAAIEGGQSGEAVIDFLDCTNPAICVYFKTLTAAQIKEQFGKDAILSRALTLPNFDQWLDEAVKYLHSDEETSRVN